MTIEHIKVKCEDGVALTATLLLATQPRAVVQISGGTGFKRGFFQPFAEFLAENGYTSIIFDYRGTFDTSKDFKSCGYTFLDYGTKDMPAVMAYLAERFPELPKYYIGHSVGAQQVGYMHNYHLINGLVVLMAGSGHWGNMHWKYAIKALFFFYIFSPLSVLFTGYVKAKPFGIMENLPKNVVSQWRLWCSKSSYFFDKSIYGKKVPIGNFQDYNFPIHLFYATDDPGATLKNINAFWSNVKTTQKFDIQSLNPKDYDLKYIDHYGFFKKNVQEKLWVLVLEKLNFYQNQSILR